VILQLKNVLPGRVNFLKSKFFQDIMYIFNSHTVCGSHDFYIPDKYEITVKTQYHYPYLNTIDIDIGDDSVDRVFFMEMEYENNNLPRVSIPLKELSIGKSLGPTFAMFDSEDKMLFEIVRIKEGSVSNV
jgi:hypothetical protein